MRARTSSRSQTRVAKAARTNKAAKASSMPIRDWTCESPSQISSTPATAAEQRRPGEPAGDADHQQHGHRPGQRRRGAPAPAVVAEQPLADRDELLAQRGVHDQLVAGVVLDAAVAQHLPGLRHVVLLVEDRGAPVRGPVEPDEPHDAGDQRERERDDPAAQPVGRRRGPEPQAGRRGRLRRGPPGPSAGTSGVAAVVVPDGRPGRPSTGSTRWRPGGRRRCSPPRGRS